MKIKNLFRLFIFSFLLPIIFTSSALAMKVQPDEQKLQPMTIIPLDAENPATRNVVNEGQQSPYGGAQTAVHEGSRNTRSFADSLETDVSFVFPDEPAEPLVSPAKHAVPKDLPETRCVACGQDCEASNAYKIKLPCNHYVHLDCLTQFFIAHKQVGHAVPEFTCSVCNLTCDIDPVKILRTRAIKHVVCGTTNGVIETTSSIGTALITCGIIPFIMPQYPLEGTILIASLNLAILSGIGITEIICLSKSRKNIFFSCGAIGNIYYGIKNFMKARKLKHEIAAAQKALQNPV